MPALFTARWSAPYVSTANCTIRSLSAASAEFASNALAVPRRPRSHPRRAVRRLLDVGDDDLRTRRGELLRDRFADAAATTGDDGDLALELGHVLLLPSF